MDEAFQLQVNAELETTGLGCLRRDLSGADLTTLKIGGLVKNLVTIHSSEHAAAVISILCNAAGTWRTLGFGSNVLVGDNGLSDWTLRLAPVFRRVERIENNRFLVQGAASLMSLARDLSADGFSGLEFAGGIPASLAGAVYMNAGAHGSDMASIVEFVEGVTESGEFIRIPARDLQWQYRSSGLPAKFLVLGAVLRLSEGDRTRIQGALQHNLAERKKRQPLTRPSAGSIFKNPSSKLSAGKLIEDSGLKGERLGGAMISEMHANWIVNPQRTASAADVIGLIKLCQDSVRAKSGIDLHPEVRVWG